MDNILEKVCPSGRSDGKHFSSLWSSTHDSESQQERTDLPHLNHTSLGGR